MLPENIQVDFDSKYLDFIDKFDEHENTMMEYPHINVAMDADNLITKMKPYLNIPKKKRDCNELLQLLDDTQAMDAHNS